MKKLFAIAAGLLLIATLNANAQIYGEVGYINSSMFGQIGGESIDAIHSNGIYAGASYDVLEKGNLHVIPGAYLAFYGNHSENGLSMFGVSQNAKSKFREMTFNVPIHVYHINEFETGKKLFAFMGPTFQLGLFSNTRTASSGVIEDTDIFHHYADGDYHRFNILLGLGIGGQFSNFFAKVGFDYGILNIYAGDTEDSNFNRANIRIGVGYVF